VVKISNLKYRPGVGAVLFNAQGKVWVGRRVSKQDNKPSHFWQMPQGGMDKGETPEEAVYRELEEETGTSKAEIITETTEWLTYDLPKGLAKRSWNGKFVGQRQKWFAMKFTGTDDDFDLNSHKKPEFSDWRWENIQDLPDLIVPFKRQMYEAIVKEFIHIPEKVSAS